jgi:hypothetical protein
MNAIRHWGSTAEERAESYPCDRHAPTDAQALFRAIDVAAPPGLVFAWLCQMRVAPYSYDWIDNLGRTSPRERDPQNENLREGQRMMLVFRLVEFARGEHLTLVWDGPAAMGRGALTYAVRSRPGGSRLIVKVLYRLPFWSPLRWILPAGDWVMMRRQLLTFQELAERDARA